MELETESGVGSCRSFLIRFFLFFNFFFVIVMNHASFCADSIHVDANKEEPLKDTQQDTPSWDAGYPYLGAEMDVVLK